MNGCLWSLYICFWAFSLLLLPWVYVFWGEELVFLKVHPFIFLWPLRWPVRPCVCVLCFGVKSSCSWRCIHSETLEGRQQIEKYGTPICVEGLFWKMFVWRSNDCYIPPPFLGPRGPLVEPSIFPSTRPVRPQQLFQSSYIQAYMPYESSEVSSNQPDGTKGSHRCPLDPLGPYRPTPWPPGTL